jgi:RNA polymerase sigma-70 factor (ECF subfamily)
MGDLSSSLPLPRLTTCADGRDCEPERLKQIREEVANLYLLRRDIIFRFLLLNLRNRTEAEDLTQEAFLRLYVHYASGRSVESPLHWMLTVARNLVIDRTRRLRREVPCVDNVWSLLTATQIDLAPSAEGTIITEERSAELNRAISGLKDSEKDCLTLRLKGLAFREIAAALGIPMSAVVTQTSRAIEKVRRRVNE